jgi:hypothetical protein
VALILFRTAGLWPAHALVDRSRRKPIRAFESGALLHLAEKFGPFLPKEAATRAECLSDRRRL